MFNTHTHTQLHIWKFQVISDYNESGSVKSVTYQFLPTKELVTDSWLCPI